MSAADMIRTLWTDKMTVYEMQSYKRANGSTGQKLAVKVENEPCRLSFSSLSITDTSQNVAQVVQSAQLFCDSGVQINAGSQIEVTHAGRTFTFKRSGEPGVYPITQHQEFPVVPVKKWVD